MERGEMFNGRVDMSQGAQAALIPCVSIFGCRARVILVPGLKLSLRLGQRRHRSEGSRPSLDTSNGFKHNENSGGMNPRRGLCLGND